MLRLAARVLNEATMGFLAIAALASALVPELFAVTPSTEGALLAADWVIIALFAAEYVVQLALAEQKRRFVLNPWRLLDLLIIAGPFVALASGASAARSTPALRILRLARVILFGARAGGALRRPAVGPERPPPEGPPTVSVLREGDPGSKPAAWEDLLRWASSPTHDWHHASNLTASRLHEIARAAGVPNVLVEAALHEASFPRLEATPRWTALTAWMPRPDGRRDAVLLLVAKDDLLTLSVSPIDLHAGASGPADLPWGPRCALAILRRILASQEEAVARLERDVRALEELPADESPEAFFERTFHLKRALSMAKGDLWRLRGILELLADGRRELPGVDADHRAALRALADEADWLHETVDAVRENLLSLLDLHLNVAQHEINRFMRVLAIASTLALIPAITGGLLGMNLRDAPWTATLGQVSFGVGITMLAVLYAFFAKGWMR